MKNEEYLNPADGLIYCSKCGKPRQMLLEGLPGLMSPIPRRQPASSTLPTPASGCNTRRLPPKKPRKRPARPFAPSIVTRLSQTRPRKRPLGRPSGDPPRS